MSHEAEIAALLRADATLIAILTGGIYSSEQVGIEGIRRGSDDVDDDDYSPTADAFDENGFLRPCALVVDGTLAPFGDVNDLNEKVASASQTTRVFYYQDRGHAAITSAKERGYAVLQGRQITDAYRAEWVFETAPFPDTGPVKNSTTLRQDWQVRKIRRG